MADEKCGDNESNLEKVILAPYTHVMKVKGKKVRVKIASAFNYWLKVPDEKMKEIAEVINFLHISGLLLDDIQDNSTDRRGLPAAHCIYGVRATVTSAFHVLFLAVERAYLLHPQAPRILIEHVLKACRGQGMDIYWRDNFLCPTEERYKKMTELKTGEMFNMAYRIMQLFSENKTDYTKLVLMLGIYFQIRDDFCNLKLQEELEEWPGVEDSNANKSNAFCEDITEGKFSLPVIYSLQTPEGNKIFKTDILRQRTCDVALKKYFVSLLESTGSLQYTCDTLARLDRDIRNEIACLGGNPMMEAVLDELLSWSTS